MEASLWRRFAGEAIDTALYGGIHVGYRIARRVAADDASGRETAPKLVERVRTAFAKELKPTEQAGEPMGELTTKKLLEMTGRVGWSRERAVSVLVSGLAQAGPMILTGGQTPGRALVGVRVVSLDGRPMTTRQALVRAFGWWALVAPLDLSPLTPTTRGAAKLTLTVFAAAVWFIDRRSLSDRLAGTRVVRAL